MEKFRFKLILIGAAAVGKTTLFHQFISGEFNLDYTATVGVQFLTKNITLDCDDGSKKDVHLALWDVAGQPRFVDLRTTFYRGAHGALLIFDLTRRESFDELNLWIKELRTVIEEDIPILLIGNKKDLIEELGRQIQFKRAEDYAKGLNLFYVETSAKTGENVLEAFFELSRRMILCELNTQMI